MSIVQTILLLLGACAQTAAAAAPSVVVGDPARVEALWRTHEQNRQSFAALRLSVEWTHSIPKERRESARRELRVLKARVAKFTRTLSPLESRGIESKSQQLEGVAGGKNSDFGTSRVQFTTSRDGMEVRTDLVANDTLMLDAKKRGLKSWTGGDFDIYRHDGGEKWRGLHPYPYLGQSDPVGYGLSSLRLGLTLPPMIPHKNIQSPIDPLDLFWGPRSQVKHLGRVPLDGGLNYELFARPDDRSPNLVWVMAAASENHGLASWVSVFYLLDRRNEGAEKARDEFLGGGRQALVRDAAELIESMRDRWFMGRPKDLQLLNVTYYDAIREVPDAGWYPRGVRHSWFGSVRLANSRDEEDEGNLPLGRHKDETLTVKSIEANFSLPSDAFTLKYDTGTNYNDVDTQEAGVIGVSLDDQIRRIVPLGKPTDWRRVVFAANVVLLVLVGVVLVLRARVKKRRVPGSSL